MGNGAHIKDGSILVDTDAWLAARTGGPVPELTDLYYDFDRAVDKQTYLTLDTVQLFITARCGPDWEDEEFATIQTTDGGGLVNLSEDITIRRYIDPSHGPTALVTTETHSRNGTTTAYSDSNTDSTSWFSYDYVDISCPNGHGWHYQGGDLTDSEGRSQTTKDVFGDDDIVTTDDDWESETYKEDRIICPTCGQHCDVSLST